MKVVLILVLTVAAFAGGYIYGRKTAKPNKVQFEQAIKEASKLYTQQENERAKKKKIDLGVDSLRGDRLDVVFDSLRNTVSAEW